VGIGTALADDPALTVRHGRRPRLAPRRVVFDRRARLPLDSLLVRTARETPVLVVTVEPDGAAASALAAAGVEIVGAASLPEALRSLATLGVHAMLVEGGAGLAGAMLAHRVVDRLAIFQAPVLLGAGALPAFGRAPAATAGTAPRLRLVSRRAIGDDLLSVFDLHQG
jgi:diaminohydroxyphosphoribosylaminopyrimidine deaminase/5-amino-6-(5-phosphoribosylamino)uracil reductase